jgi:hypothetical protein
MEMALTIKRRVTLDLARRGAQVTIPFSRGDRAAYEVIFTIIDGVEPVNLPPGTIAAVAVKNGINDSGVVDPCVVDHVNGTLKYIPSADALAVSGNVSVTLTLADETGAVIGAPALIFCIADDGGIETEDEVAIALKASSGWPIIAQTETNAQSAAQSKDEAEQYMRKSRAWAEGGGEDDPEDIIGGGTSAKAYAEAAKAALAETIKCRDNAEIHAELSIEHADVARDEAQAAEAAAVLAKRWAIGSDDPEYDDPTEHSAKSYSEKALGYANAARSSSFTAGQHANNAQKYSTLRFNIRSDPTTYTYTLEIYREGQQAPLASAVLDFPFEETVIGGSYDSDNKKIILKLKNGNEVKIPIGDVVNENAFVHRKSYNKGEVAAYVEKRDGTSDLIPINIYSSNETGNSLVRRGSDGAIHARGNPEHETEAVPKWYVDSIVDVLYAKIGEFNKKLTELEERINNLPSTPDSVVSAEVVGATLKLTGATVRGTTLVLPKGSATVTDGILKFK